MAWRQSLGAPTGRFPPPPKPRKPAGTSGGSGVEEDVAAVAQGAPSPAVVPHPIGTHSMCSAGVGDPPRKPRSVAETGKQTEREPMMSSGAPHNVKQQAPGIGAPPANSEQWRCSVEVA